MSKTTAKIGWIGIGRMGYEMALRLAKGGCDLTVYNRTRAKAEPLAKHGARIADDVSELATCDIVFCMVSTYTDVKAVIAGAGGLLSKAKGKSGAPRIVVECSSISLDGSAELRGILAQHGTQMLAAPVSGNAKVIKAGKLSFVCSGPKAVFDEVSPLLRLIAPSASYVGEGELARIVKICHNVFLGVVTQSLGQRLRDDAEEHVVADLHDTGEFALADVARGRRDEPEQRRHLVKHRLGPRADETQLSGLDHLGVARHRRRKHLRAVLRQNAAQLGRAFERNRGTFDHDARCAALAFGFREQSAGPGNDRFHVGVGRHHAEHDVAGGELGHVVRNARAVLGQWLRLGARAVVYGEIAAGLGQPQRHFVSHAADADPADFCSGLAHSDFPKLPL